ncbi:response regulator [Curvibacter sp. APW13]|uniref:ATP-binding response regulator n=1 Tax=Curvibacter sp. APW13 TaxID=3077236 RepID=UPI0028E0939E|nr:response regulator [Curvibacter sp. APW13]MDT8990521.1 response regulator [Curvibacter sp. APW13]
MYNSPHPENLSKESVFLVVDDFDTMRRVTVNQLRLLGAEKILAARDGIEALRLLRHQPVDMILSDWNMPVMDGLSLLLAVRADAKLAGIPFIMITAEAERPRVELAIANGVSSMLLKPYSPRQLMSRIQKGFEWRPRRLGSVSSQDSAKAGASPPGQDPKAIPSMGSGTRDRPLILIVDDTPDNLMLLTQLLKDDYRVRVAQSGAKALEVCTGDSPPDLVLLDIMMPGMDGFEVAQRMREHPSSESIPVIFVTAMTDTDARVKGMELGAVDFITKPINPDILKPRVRNFMRYVELRRNLQADYDQMVEAAQLRQDVEHITRHDLKGPLAGVLAVVQGLMLDSSMAQQHVEQLKIVEETALQVLGMVNLSSELYKIENGQYALDPKPVPVEDMLRRVAEIDRITFGSKDLTISVETEKRGDTTMLQALGDAMLCYSIFQNLLKNACEAAPSGSRIRVQLYDQDPLRIVITNSGVVPQAIRDRFFDKYTTQGKEGGTGLGTYSARLLTEAQGGSIAVSVHDETDTTTITLTLPRARVEDQG